MELVADTVVPCLHPHELVVLFVDLFVICVGVEPHQVVVYASPTLGQLFGNDNVELYAAGGFRFTYDAGYSYCFIH